MTSKEAKDKIMQDIKRTAAEESAANFDPKKVERYAGFLPGDRAYFMNRDAEYALRRPMTGWTT